METAHGSPPLRLPPAVLLLARVRSRRVLQQDWGCAPAGDRDHGPLDRRGGRSPRYLQRDASPARLCKLQPLLRRRVHLEDRAIQRQRLLLHGDPVCVLRNEERVGAMGGLPSVPDASHMISECPVCIALRSSACSHVGSDGSCTGFIAKSYKEALAELFHVRKMQHAPPPSLPIKGDGKDFLTNGNT